LPVFAACIGPLANMISIAALVNNWRQGENDRDIFDTPSILTLNAISLILGCISSFSLMLNFGQRINYRLSHIISIFGFLCASILLLVAVILANVFYFVRDDFTKAEGFWFAIMAVVLYASCSLTCGLNLLGYLLRKYPPRFNLEFSERSLIGYTFLLAVWLLWGAAMFSKLLNLSYGDGMYYCVISLLTIGLGDITPNSDATRGLSLVYSLTGVMILGLIIAMIGGVSISSSAPVYFWNKVEADRKKLYNKLRVKSNRISSEDSFKMIRSIRKHSRKIAHRTSSLVTLVIFITFWLIGALIFHFAEDNWGYFDAVYFCFLCLLTIGYGDFAPKSSAGRAFFIVWALGAVPLMTALISKVGDNIFMIARYGMSLKIVRTIFAKPQNDEDDVSEKLREEAVDNTEERSVNEMLSDVSDRSVRSRRKEHTRELMKYLKKLILAAKENPQKKYCFDEWSRMIELLEVGDDVTSDSLFWISDRSPLGFPISEPNYILFLFFERLEKRLLGDMELLDTVVSSGS